MLEILQRNRKYYFEKLKKKKISFQKLEKISRHKVNGVQKCIK